MVTMGRRVVASALGIALLFFGLVSGLSSLGPTASGSPAPTVAAAHQRAAAHGSERRPGAALTQMAAERPAPGWAPLDPPVADLASAAWTPGDFVAPELVSVAGLSVVTAGAVHHQGRAPPSGLSVLT